jgi:uncharacterized protein YndB with AHSA1/START domain
MDFIVNKEAKTVTITAEFAAGHDLVWDAYTKQELLDKWWAPKPFTSRTKEMNFEEGGKRFYAMVSPDGEEHWALQQYKTITPKTRFTLFNAFADAEGNAQQPGSHWDLRFYEENGKTKVTVSIYNESLERMEQLLAMGFKEGITATHSQLAELLAEVAKQR